MFFLSSFISPIIFFLVQLLITIIIDSVWGSTPPLSLLRDLRALLAGEHPESLGRFHEHPGIGLLLALRWPSPAWPGLANRWTQRNSSPHRWDPRWHHRDPRPCPGYYSIPCRCD